MWPPIQSGLLVDEDDELFCGEQDSVARAIAACVDLRELCSANLPKSIKESSSRGLNSWETEPSCGFDAPAIHVSAVVGSNDQYLQVLL